MSMDERFTRDVWNLSEVKGKLSSFGVVYGKRRD